MSINSSLIRTLAVAAVALSLGQPAAAVEDSDFRFDTTQDLHAVCSVPGNTAEYAMAHQACRAFIEGAMQYHDSVSKPKQLKRLICYPAQSTIDDGILAFNAWATAKAADAKLMGEPPVVGLVRALAAKYPCKG